MSPGTDNKLRTRLAIGGVVLTLLLAAVFTFGSLDIPWEPGHWREVIPLFALTCFITAALLVFGLIFVRSFVRLQMERSKAQLGARFKTKMVLGATAISLLPVIFMFFVSYSLLNRTLGRWFPRPLEIASEETQKLLNELGASTLPRLHILAYEAGQHASDSPEAFVQRALGIGLDAVWLFDSKGNFVKGGVVCDEQPENRTAQLCSVSGVQGSLVKKLPSGVEIWQAKDRTYFAATVAVSLGDAGIQTRSGQVTASATKAEPRRKSPPSEIEGGAPAQQEPTRKGGVWGTPESPRAQTRVSVPQEQGKLVAGFRTSPSFVQRWTTIQEQTLQYENVKQNLRVVKKQMLLLLFFFTLLVLSASTWVALFLSKQVTVPIQALAEGTREVSAGNFDYQVPEQVQDELGVLIKSFNSMTTQLRDSRTQIDEFTRNLQQAVQELERRRQLMETVLENIPAGVIYLDANGAVQRTNTGLTKMFGFASREPASLEEAVGAEAHLTLQHLMRRALRMGLVSREIEVTISDRVLHLAVTVSSLGPRRANTGYVIVFDDLTEVLRAQKSAAWQEVARRIAHEIKNPLTPIQLSAQRILHHLEARNGATDEAKDSQLAQISQESAKLIVREVATLSQLVNEFSQFVRFPTAKLQPTDPNTTVNEALEVFAGRLDGIQLKTSLEQNLPAVRADGPLLRSVLVNLIDNAAEALEDSPAREITVATHLRAESDTIEIAVADTGHGISPEDKDKLFLPHFSTKDRGTGLGLAIAARIISEHGGSLRVEDNRPVGSRFLIELPVAETAEVRG